jgi:hypothetical protein
MLCGSLANAASMCAHGSAHVMRRRALGREPAPFVCLQTAVTWSPLPLRGHSSTLPQCLFEAELWMRSSRCGECRLTAVGILQRCPYAPGAPAGTPARPSPRAYRPAFHCWHDRARRWAAAGAAPPRAGPEASCPPDAGASDTLHLALTGELPSPSGAAETPCAITRAPERGDTASSEARVHDFECQKPSAAQALSENSKQRNGKPSRRTATCTGPERRRGDEESAQAGESVNRARSVAGVTPPLRLSSLREHGQLGQSDTTTPSLT